MINIPIEQTIMSDALTKWGPTPQLLVAVEEAAEFIQAAMKYHNRGGDVQPLIEETSHCLFLMMQMRYILGENSVDEELEKVQARLLSKLNR